MAMFSQYIDIKKYWGNIRVDSNAAGNIQGGNRFALPRPYPELKVANGNKS